MEFDYFDTIYSVLFPIVFGVMAIFFLGIGLRAILTKRPFLVSNRWRLLMMFVIFIPMILRIFVRPPGDLTGWVHPILFSVILVMMWYQLKGYVAYAVTDASFREALLAALQRLELPYEESLSVIRLTSVNADMQVAVQSWMGTSTIKVKQREHRAVLTEVVKAMNDYFRTSSASTNMITSVFMVVLGVVMTILALERTFFKGIF